MSRHGVGENGEKVRPRHVVFVVAAAALWRCSHRIVITCGGKADEMGHGEDKMLVSARYDWNGGL